MIDVVMATYNGEKYLDMQILSIINQTYKDWLLYVHDDGSTDNTLKILSFWAAKDKRIKIINDNCLHLGPGNNFFYLFPYCSSDYICFCDQDDIWFENKLEVYIETMKNFDNSIPVCALFSAYVWNETQGYVTPFLNEYCKDVNSLFFTGGTQGCSMVFNKKLVEIAKKFVDANIFLHDYLVMLIAMTFGYVIYKDTRLMFYRQHSSNVTTHMPKNMIEKIKTALVENYNVSFVSPKMYEDISTFFEILKDKMDADQYRLYTTYLKLPKLSPIQRFVKLLFSSYRIGKHSRFYFILKYLLRKKYL